MATALTYAPLTTPATPRRRHRVFVARLSAAQRQALRERTHSPRQNDERIGSWLETVCFAMVAVSFAALIGMAFGRAFDVPPATGVIAAHVDEAVTPPPASAATGQTLARPGQPSSEPVSRTM